MSVTSKRQLAANRRNAARSTGPKTGAGKKKASRNSKKHGLNSEPDPAEVVLFYRIILQEADAELEFSMPGEREAAALDLANAEVRLR